MSNDRIIDMSQLPPPEVIRQVDFEQKLAELKADFLEVAPECEAALQLESSVLSKTFQFLAYLFMMDAQRSNEDAWAVMLAYAQDADLDNLGAWLQVERLVITPEDTTTTPPTPAVLEGDEALRRRIQLAPKGFSTAGPLDAYVFHALSADGRVLDVLADSPQKGIAQVTLLSHEGNGTASAELTAIVEQALNQKDTSPMTDLVQVQSAGIVAYTIEANVYTLLGPDTGLVMQQVQASIDTYVKEARAIGVPVPLSGIYAALHLSGVERVELLSPTVDIALGKYQAAHCADVVLNHRRASDE